MPRLRTYGDATKGEGSKSDYEENRHKSQNDKKRHIIQYSIKQGVILEVTLTWSHKKQSIAMTIEKKNVLKKETV